MFHFNVADTFISKSSCLLVIVSRSFEFFCRFIWKSFQLVVCIFRCCK